MKLKMRRRNKEDCSFVEMGFTGWTTHQHITGHIAPKEHLESVNCIENICQHEEIELLTCWREFELLACCNECELLMFWLYFGINVNC